MTNMRLFVATLALLASASAYAPSQRSARRPTRMAAEVVDRRAALSAAVSGAVALGALGALAPAARADGAVSKATVSRARGIYGAKITALAGAAKVGDLKAFEAERGAFDIFSSSGYARSTLAEKKAVKAGVAEIYAAVAARDKPAVEAAYARFTKAYVPVNPFGDSVGVDAGQGCATGCDYDWKARTPKGTLFIF